MNNNKDIIDFIFIQKEIEGLFNFNTKEEKKLNNEMDIINTQIINLIDKKVNPKCRKKLKKLISTYSTSIGNYFQSQNEIFYRTGFLDGANIILSILSKE